MQELTEIFLVFFPANAGEVLTEAEQDALDEYRAEVAAFAEQRLFGNKVFMKKLITTEPSTAEKLIRGTRERVEYAHDRIFRAFLLAISL